MKCRKPVSVILIAAFVELTTSCTTLKRLSPDAVSPPAKKYRIVRILKKTGERIEIDKATPARIVGSDIHIGGRLRIPTAGTTVVKRGGGYLVTPPNGLSFETDSLDTVEKISVNDEVRHSDPLSEVSVVWNKETNAGMTILAVVGGVAIAAGIVLAIAALGFKNAVQSIDWGF